MSATWSFYSAGQLTFGWGATGRLSSESQRRGWQRLLVVTDEVLREAGVVEAVVGPLASAGLEVDLFTGGEPEPSIAAAVAATEAAARFRPDAIVGLGGGSNMDLAKMTAILYSHGGQAADYFSFDRVPGPVVPLVGIPTTAGTGSEVSHAAVLTDTQQQIKVSSLSPHLRPTLALVDPQLTMSCPPKVTADSGIDALTHAIEACTATDFDELDLAPADRAYDGRYVLGDCLADKAIELIGRHLPAAVQDGSDRNAREGMALAATLAGLAFSNCGVALVHALEYPIGAVLHCSHGAGNGLLLPFVMEFNLPRREATFARIAGLLGQDTSHGDQAQAARQAIDAVHRLKEQIGIPARIRDLGGTREQLPGFAEKAFAIKRLLAVNPRPASCADLQGILENAF